MKYNSDTHEILHCSDGEFSKDVLVPKNLKSGEKVNALVVSPKSGPKRIRVIITDGLLCRHAKPLKPLSIPVHLNPNLTVSKSRNLGTQREFNHLRISNIDVFLKEYANNIEFYASPFQILRELELAVMFKNDPDDFLLIDYKPNGGDGDIMFRLKSVARGEYHLDKRRIVTYTYDGSVS